MIEYKKCKCDKCNSENTKLEKWETEYVKCTLLTCLNCGYVVGTHKRKKDFNYEKVTRKINQKR